MVITYEDVNPTLIPNTTMKKTLRDGVHTNYRIQPNEGYVIHDKARDMVDLDPDTMEETLKRGYTTTYASCGANYAFTPVTIADENGVTFTAYGSREFAARLATDVPADQIFGVGKPDHEIM